MLSVLKRYFKEDPIHSDISLLHDAFKKLNLKGPFLDAGSGDGRVVALAASLGMKSVGVEMNKERFNNSKNIFKLVKNVLLVNGDFTDDLAYKKAGHYFSDFSTIFNYYDNHWLVAGKIARMSKLGTKLLLLSPSLAPPFEGLSHKKTIELNTWPKKFLYVYEK